MILLKKSNLNHNSAFYVGHGQWKGKNIQTPNEDVEEISSLSYVIGINH